MARIKLVALDHYQSVYETTIVGLSLLQNAKLAQFIPIDIGVKFVELGLSLSNSYK